MPEASSLVPAYLEPDPLIEAYKAAGDIDLLGEITGGGGYEALLPHTATVRPCGVECLCLTLEKLIQVERAAGRSKDLEAIAELEALRDERDGR